MLRCTPLATCWCRLSRAVIFDCSGDDEAVEAVGRRAGPADAENKKKAKPAPWEVCESFGPGKCDDNRDRCSLCKEKYSGTELCFRPHVAAKLPPCE